MAKVYALIEFTDRTNVRREVNEGFDLPRNTDREKAEFQRFIDYGIVTQTEPKVARAVDESDEAPQRARRNPE